MDYMDVNHLKNQLKVLINIIYILMAVNLSFFRFYLKDFLVRLNLIENIFILRLGVLFLFF